jgi:hypothetical protein
MTRSWKRIHQLSALSPARRVQWIRLCWPAPTQHRNDIVISPSKTFNTVITPKNTTSLPEAALRVTGQTGAVDTALLAGAQADDLAVQGVADGVGLGVLSQQDLQHRHHPQEHYFPSRGCSP